ncbi:MAG: argonaute/piwi family protein [Verrucomicrobiales bacterium]
MIVELLPEPELEFGAGKHIDIRFGLKNYGPVTFEVDTAPKQIQVGFVGTAKTIQGVKDWMEGAKSGVAAKASKKVNFFPAFPGFGNESCFNCDWITSERLTRAIPQRDINRVITLPDKTGSVRAAVDLIMGECHYITENTKADVIVCAPPLDLLGHVDPGKLSVEGEEASNTKEREEGTADLDLHDMLKAQGLGLHAPIQYIRPSTYDESVKEISGTGRRRQLQDPATRAWNFFTALYYKAGGTPWRLERKVSAFESCFVGVSFFHSLDRQSVNTSVAQVFNERGEGMILRGGEATISKEDRQPHLTGADMKTLIGRSLQEFDREHGHLPARVVIHKTSSFSSDELDGCNAAIDDLRIKSRDLLVIRESSVRLFRAGQYPPLRGTFVQLDKRRSLLYTRGSISFYQMYPGMYVPRALEVHSIEAETPARSLAQEILALTKMNWNNTQFDSALPITLRAAKQVGAILKYTNSQTQLSASYAYYM